MKYSVSPGLPIAVAIGEREAVRVVAGDVQRRRQLGRRVRRQRDRLAAAERHLAGRGRTIGEHLHADVGAGRRVDVAAVGFGARRQPQAGGIGVVDVDARHARRHRDGDLVGRRRHRAGDDAVLERRADRRQREAERARGVARSSRVARQRSPSAICTCAITGARLPTSRASNRQRRSRFDSARSPASPRARRGPGTASATRHRTPAAPGRARRTARAPSTSTGGRRLEAGAAQRLAEHDRVDVDRRRAPRRVGDHQLGQRRRVLGAWRRRPR